MTLERLTQITSVGISSGITLNNTTLTGVTTIASLSASGDIDAANGTFSGNVGIGTDNPDSKLNVESTSTLVSNFVRTNSGAGAFRFQVQDGESSILQLGDISDGDIQRITSDNSDNSLYFHTNNNERLRIDSSGRVGIGSETPQAALDVASTTPVIRFTDTDAGQYTELLNSGSSFYISADRGNGGNGDIIFRSGGTSEKVRITSGGDVNVAAGGSVFIGNGNLVFSTSGTGIDFSATSNSSGTMTSELLDDYEEGTFTPTFTGTTTNPTITYLNQLGRYTKIGNVCYIEIRMVTSNVSGGSGDLRISGLPFSQSASSNLGGAFTKGFVYAWTQDPETFINFSGGSEIFIYRNDSTNTIAQVSDLTSGAANNYCNISGCYITA